MRHRGAVEDHLLHRQHGDERVEAPEPEVENDRHEVQPEAQIGHEEPSDPYRRVDELGDEIDEQRGREAKKDAGQTAQKQSEHRRHGVRHDDERSHAGAAKKA